MRADVTASFTAAVRARESTRPDRLFHDPLAETLAGPEGLMALRTSEASNRHADRTAAMLAIRTRFFDDLLTEAVARGARQVVLLGAGMDARAFRLPWPEGTVVFEVDHAELLATKAARLGDARARCRRATVAADLAGDWTGSLVAAGFDRAAASAWLVEGVLPYLAPESADALIGRISDATVPGSSLGADLVSASFLSSGWTADALCRLRDAGFPWRFGTDDPEGFFARHDFHATAAQPGEPSASYGRWPWPVAPRGTADLPRQFFVAAWRE